MFRVRRVPVWLLGGAVVVSLAGCSSPTIHSFTLSAGPSTILVSPGGTNYLTVAASSSDSTPITAAVVVYDLPNGVTISPASPTVTTGATTTISITAAPNAPAASGQIQVTGISGLAHSSVYLTFGVTAQ